ncbi:MAG: hypothetical protein ACI9JZ_002748, partial [Lentimonas sp.]
RQKRRAELVLMYDQITIRSNLHGMSFHCRLEIGILN